MAFFEDSGKPPFPLLHQYRPKGADFSPDSKVFVTAEPSGAIRFWNTETGELIQPVVDFGEGVDSVEFSPDGKTVLAGGREGLTRTISTVTRIRCPIKLIEPHVLGSSPSGFNGRSLIFIYFPTGR